ncbi:MAG TPA: DUF1697 domain-containing protein [Ideonella sp.]|nr:DUF1697 domain-containing protein [Ideonella sp.]
MARHVAFLRAINVGGRLVKKEALKAIFEGLALKDVQTVIASGNVIFDGGRSAEATLVKRIEQGLHGALGFEVDTFVRTAAEMARIAAWRPAGCEDLPDDHNLLVGFLSQPLSAEQAAVLPAMGTAHDALFGHERELWWLCRGRQSDSLLGSGQPERRLKLRTTFRKSTTVQLIADLLAR